MSGPSRAGFIGGLTAAGLLAGRAGAASLPPLSVKVINTGAGDSFTFQRLLTDEKIYERFNLDASDTQNVSDGVKVLAAIVNGGADIAVLNGIPQVFPAITHGAPVKIIAASMNACDYVCFSGNPAVKSLKDLEGKSVGTGAIGALAYTAMAAMLKTAGVDLSKVTFVNIGSTQDVFKAIAAKKIDAGPCQHEFIAEAAKLGVHVVADAVNVIPRFTYQAAYASEHTIATKRDVLVRTLAAYGTGFRFIDGPSSRDAYVKAYQAAVGGTAATGLAKWEWFQKTHAYAGNLILTPDRIDYLQDLNVAFGTQPKKLPLEQVADLSIARDAARMLH